MVEITFKLDVFLFNLTTSKLSNYFQPTQNSEEPTLIKKQVIDLGGLNLSIDTRKEYIKAFEPPPGGGGGTSGVHNTVFVDNENMEIIKDSIAKFNLKPTPPPSDGIWYGGIKIPHVHYDGKMYQLTDKQWIEFSQQIIDKFQSKLSHAKGINFNQLMELSDAMSEIISDE